MPQFPNRCAAEGETKRLSESLEPLDCFRSLLFGRYSTRPLLSLPKRNGFGNHVFGRAIVAGKNRILDDSLNLRWKIDSHGTSLLPPYTRFLCCVKLAQDERGQYRFPAGLGQRSVNRVRGAIGVAAYVTLLTWLGKKEQAPGA
jgi:hypothetical protein